MATSKIFAFAYFGFDSERTTRWELGIYSWIYRVDLFASGSTYTNSSPIQSTSNHPPQQTFYFSIEKPPQAFS